MTTRAWEVTEEDIQTVLDAHNSDINAEEALGAVDPSRIEGAILWYTDFDDQVKAALSEIENSLIEDKVVNGVKKWNAPK